MRFDVPLKISRVSARVNWCQRTVFLWSTSKRHQQRNCLARFPCFTSFPSCPKGKKERREKSQIWIQMRSLEFATPELLQGPRWEEIVTKIWICRAFRHMLQQSLCLFKHSLPQIELDVIPSLQLMIPGRAQATVILNTSLQCPPCSEMPGDETFSQGREHACFLQVGLLLWQPIHLPSLTLQHWFERSRRNFSCECTSLSYNCCGNPEREIKWKSN